MTGNVGAEKANVHELVWWEVRKKTNSKWGARSATNQTGLKKVLQADSA